MTNKFFCASDEAVVMVDKESYYDLKKKAEINDKEIQNRAVKIIQNILTEDGLDIRLHINDKETAFYPHGEIIIQDNHNEISWGDSAFIILKNTKSRIVSDMVTEANKQLEGIRLKIREQLIKEAKQISTRKVRVWLWATGCSWGLLIISLLYNLLH